MRYLQGAGHKCYSSLRSPADAQSSHWTAARSATHITLKLSSSSLSSLSFSLSLCSRSFPFPISEPTVLSFFSQKLHTCISHVLHRPNDSVFYTKTVYMYITCFTQVQWQGVLHKNCMSRVLYQDLMLPVWLHVIHTHKDSHSSTVCPQHYTITTHQPPRTKEHSNTTAGTARLSQLANVQMRAPGPSFSPAGLLTKG